jgi:LacI family transcriptional regulator
MTRRPTIVDVARKAGVSKSTVSLVLQASPAVRPETRTAVRRAMADIGYVYNRAAANLRSANAGLVGLVINDLRNPFFTEFATSLQMAMSRRGFATVLANTGEDPAVQSQVVAAMIEHGVSALILSPSYGADQSAFDMIERAALPAIQVLRRVDPRGDLFPFAAPDYALGSRIAAEHLFDLGCRNLAFVGGVAGQSVAQERMSGYLEALARRGLRPLVLPGRATRNLGREAVASLLRDHPEVDGALCFNDLVALGMSAGLARAGLRPGTGMRLVGFDDIEEAGQAYPALSSVRCDIAGFGERIAATISDWLAEGTRPPAETRTPVELVPRASSLGGA